MAEQMSNEAIESALESAFSDTPVERPVKESTRAPEPDEVPALEAQEGGDDASDEQPEADGEDAAPAEDAEAAEAKAAPEPEFEIEVNGSREIVRGNDAIKELLQKGRDYSIKTEQLARARDSLIAQAQQQQAVMQFNQAASDVMAELRALDSQLEQYNKIDWAAAFDSDPFQALKLKEQRDQLRETRNNKQQEFQAKREQFAQGMTQIAQQRLASENAAVLAKVREWRDSETRSKEQQEIAKSLMSVGFNQAEIDGLVDHRMLLVARKAMLFDRLQSNKAAKVQQARAAPPVVKPGAAPDKGKAESRDFIKEVRKAGRQGNHRAQEALAEKAFGRVFK